MFSIGLHETISPKNYEPCATDVTSNARPRVGFAKGPDTSRSNDDHASASIVVLRVNVSVG